MSAAVRFLNQVLRNPKVAVPVGGALGAGTVVGVDVLEPDDMPESVDEAAQIDDLTIGKRSTAGGSGSDRRSPNPRTGDYQAPPLDLEELGKLLEQLYGYPEVRAGINPYLQQQFDLEQTRATGEENRALEAWKAWRDIETTKIRANVTGQALLAQNIYLYTQRNVGTVQAYNKGTTDAIQAMAPSKLQPVGTRLGYLPMATQGMGGLLSRGSKS